MPPTRREFLVTASLAGASLLVRCKAAPEDPSDGAAPAPLRVTAWLWLHPDGVVELSTPKLEMGQGIETALVLLVAEELDIEPAAIRTRFPSTSQVPRSTRILETGSSRSVSDCWDWLRHSGAAARLLLVATAAERWGVPRRSCSTDGGGAVVHAASGRRAAYGELLAEAALRPVPRHPRLRSPREFRRIGRPTPRHDGPDIVTGRASYAADIRLEGQLFAVLERPPAPGARALRVDRAAAERMPGVRRVVELPQGFAVVAESTWHALRGREALAAEWSDGAVPGFSSAGYGGRLAEALDAPTPDGDPPAAAVPTAVAVRDVRPPGPRTPAPALELRADYATSFQAHAPMEPPNALVRLRDRTCEIWTGTQFPLFALRTVRELFADDPHEVEVHPQRMGGAFGRKEMPDFVLEAVTLARALDGGPVQLFWSREDDLRHDFFHPPSRHRLAAGVGPDGRLLSWRHRIAAPATERKRPFWRSDDTRVPWFETNGAWNPPYLAPELRVEYVEVPIPVRIGYWRGIEIANNVFAVESFVDELAHAAKRDPLGFRLDHLADTIPTGPDRSYPLSRLRAAYELVAERSGWGRPLPAGSGRGIAGLVFNGHTSCATVAEVTVNGGSLRVDRVVCAIDCGLVVNPLGLAGNAEGAVVWGLSALFSEITFERGRAVESSPLDYPLLRIDRTPAIEIHCVPSAEPPSGTGEIPVPTIAPAVANAVYAATGRRIRELPFRDGDLG